MKMEEAKKLQCVRDSSLCKGDGCMAWLAQSPQEPNKGQCAYMCVGTSMMKVLQLWAHMVTQPKSKIVGG